MRCLPQSTQSDLVKSDVYDVLELLDRSVPLGLDGLLPTCLEYLMSRMLRAALCKSGSLDVLNERFTHPHLNKVSVSLIILY